MGIVLISLLGYSQTKSASASSPGATNVGEYRIATDLLTIGVNLPVGTKVYDIEKGEYWVVITGIPAGRNLSGAKDDNLVKLLNTATQTQIDAIATNLSATGTNTIAISDEASRATAVEETNATAISTETTRATTAEGVNRTAIEVNDADIIILNDSITAHRTDIDANTAAIATISTDLSLETVDATTMEVASSSGNNVTLTAATTTSAGIMTATQVTTLNALNLLQTESQTLLTTGTTPPTTLILTKTVKDLKAIHVSINGTLIALGSGYTYSGNTITFTVPILQYDQVVVTYTTDGTAFTV